VGEDDDADVAALLGPVVALLGRHGADESGNGIFVGKMPTTPLRRRISGFEASAWVGGPDLTPDLFRERGEGQDVGVGVLQLRGDGGELVG